MAEETEVKEEVQETQETAAEAPVKEDSQSEASTEVEQEEVVNEIDFSEIDDDVPAAKKPEPTEEPSKPSAEAELKPEPTQPATSESSQQEQQPQQQSAPEPQTAQPQQQPAQTPDRAQLRSQELARVEQLYQFDEAGAREVALEPEKALPKLAARLYLDVFDNVVQTVVQSLPSLMENISQQRTARQEAENAFFTEFPGLKDSKYAPQVQSALVAYKAQNPQATMEQAIANVGVQVSFANKVALPEKYLDALGLRPNTPSRPSAPIAPAGPGGAGSAPVKPSDNYFTRVAEEDLADG